uniref:hepatocyte growth factor-regulated tyrosine kinase substrate-like isoform X1 n=1 Tax=Styela clava TaxID=7725 RepID=UPI00193A05BB|nr:hepatocyte growth factor-regulated tyrosine kinase substrate-like isoform X1 [Styela clava]
MFRSKSQFEKMLEKATSNLLLEPDFDAMLQLCDMIRGGDIKAREAVAHMKARIREEKNPNVQYFALSVLDTAMKNCGEGVHEEVITQTFLEEMKDMAKSASAERVKTKILEMVQSWGLAFKERTEYRIATNLYNIMKTEGYEFPPPTNTTDMFKSETAPVWKDGDECSKCKSEFGLVQRKHHCRACGGIFCNRCTSKQSIVPKFGIEKEVRVCDKCYDEINTKSSASTSDSGGLPQEYLNSSLAKESQIPVKRSEQELKEEEELQIALAMSLNEQENQSKSQTKDMPVYASVNKTNAIQPEVKVSASDSDLDPELARYLNRNYWEKKKDTQEKQEPKAETKKTSKSSAPPAEVQPEPVVAENANEPREPPKAEENLQNGEIEDNEEFMHGLRTSVEIFMNRMRSDQMRNRSIANDSSVQSLFQSINSMHPTLLQFMNDLEEKRLQYEALQDKLTQIRDARAALDALREEHKEKVRRAAEEAERVRQIQMAQKLEIMRQKKQEYLAYQRQIALQRMQEQEAARHARLEKQKQFIMQRAMQPAMLVQGYNVQYMPPQPNIGETAPEMQQAQGMQPAAYPPYGPGPGYQQQPATMAQPVVTQSPYTQQQMGMAPPPGQPQFHQPQMQQHSGQYQPMGAGYQQGVPDQVTAAQIQGVLPGQESFNMAGMVSALPQQGNPNIQGQQQVVATAPPPTPQATPTPQQMTQTHVTQPHMMQMQGQPQQMQGQQYYQPPQVGQDQLPPNQQLTQQQAQNLLISFD